MYPTPLLLALHLLITAHLCTTTTTTNGQAPPPFPALLVFGDSTVDTGNNNYILTPFRGDHPPYGQDFPGRVPTGRFSDGKLVPDILASLIGLKDTVPPFLDPNLSDQDVVTGVSFASAGSGYDELTTAVSRVIPMSKQPSYFKNYIRRLETIVGQKRTREILNTALVLVSAGTNDFLFNYYDVPTRRLEFTIDEYQDFVQNKLKNVVKQVYDLGGRRMVVPGIPPIGCLPIQTTLKSPILRGCSEKENAEARLYNEKLVKVLKELERENRGSRILYVDVYHPLIDMIHNPPKYGLVEGRRGCCGSGLVEAGPFCSRITPVCADPTHYLFYDSIHPTQSTYFALAHLILHNLSYFHNTSSFLLHNTTRI